MAGGIFLLHPIKDDKPSCITHLTLYIQLDCGFMNWYNDNDVKVSTTWLNCPHQPIKFICHQSGMCSYTRSVSDGGLSACGAVACELPFRHLFSHFLPFFLLYFLFYNSFILYIYQTPCLNVIIYHHYLNSRSYRIVYGVCLV